MNAPLHPELLTYPQQVSQEKSSGGEGVHRYVWQSRFGQILIEVVDGVAFVNGDRVERMDAAAIQRQEPVR